MNDRPHVTSNSSRFQEACDWFLRLREEPESTDLIAGWLDWCHGDPRNREAFDDVRETWLILGRMPAHPTPGSRDGDVQSAPALFRTRGRRTLRAAPVALLATAAGVLTIAAGLSWWLFTAPLIRSAAADVSTIATGPSEHRSFMLADGSHVEMAGASKLQVRLGEHSREIELRGEAYFNVAHDRARPFIVHAAALHVRAVGTRFDVRTASDRVVVAVEEGVVEVERPPQATGAISSILSTIRTFQGSSSPVSQVHPMRVRGGQALEIESADGRPDSRLMPIEPAAVASWREGRLHFVREPLSSVLASIRAASGQAIELTDPELGDLRFTGTVFSSQIDSWVVALPAIFPVTVRHVGVRFVISRRLEPRP